MEECLRKDTERIVSVINFSEKEVRDQRDKVRIWFFEGLDKTGKSSLCQACRLSSRHAEPFMDRGLMGKEVFYHHLREHTVNFPIKKYRNTESILMENDIYGIIYTMCSIQTILQRSKDVQEELFTQTDFQEQMHLYSASLSTRIIMKVPVIIVDTEKYSMEQNVKAILEVLQLPYFGFKSNSKEV